MLSAPPRPKSSAFGSGADPENICLPISPRPKSTGEPPRRSIWQPSRRAVGVVCHCSSGQTTPTRPTTVCGSSSPSRSELYKFSEFYTTGRRVVQRWGERPSPGERRRREEKRRCQDRDLGPGAFMGPRADFLPSSQPASGAEG